MINKAVIAAIFLLAFSALSGCLQPAEQKQYTQDESRTVAESYLKNMSEYVHNFGSNLTLLESAKGQCASCWNFVYQFTTNRTENVGTVSIARVGINVTNGAVSGSVYAERLEATDELACSTDGDCACGVSVKDGSCFFGNTAFVDTSRQCPDFCTGIAGNLRVVCMDNACVHKRCDPCPQYSPPVPGWCQNGTIEQPAVDECGCAGPPSCRIS